jgi:hypothetical protein
MRNSTRVELQFHSLLLVMFLNIQKCASKIGILRERVPEHRSICHNMRACSSFLSAYDSIVLVAPKLLARAVIISLSDFANFFIFEAMLLIFPTYKLISIHSIRFTNDKV